MEETNSNNGKAVWLTIVFLVLAVGIWSFIGGNPLNFLFKKEVSKVENNTETLSIDKDLALFEGRTKFPKLIVKSSAQANVSEFPKDLSTLILKEASSQNFNKETYTNGKVGWSISYQYADNVMNSYNEMYSVVRDAGFKIDLSSRTFSAAIVSGESTKYKIKVTSQYLDDKNSLVKISIVEN
jgi:hypothetical protein